VQSPAAHALRATMLTEADPVIPFAAALTAEGYSPGTFPAVNIPSGVTVPAPDSADHVKATPGISLSKASLARAVKACLSPAVTVAAWGSREIWATGPLSIVTAATAMTPSASDRTVPG
jgi:hypothetical protein